MQWLKSAMVVSSVLMVAAAFSVEGCSSNAKPGDGGPDAIVGKDGGKDGNTGTDSGGGQCPTSDPTCEVCDVTSFSPIPQGTPTLHANKCPAADISAFVTACLADNATQATCTAWQNAENTSNANCLACVFTEATTASWGPLVCDQQGCKLNVPGCLDLALGQQAQENQTSNGSCGDFLSASYGCQDTACGSCTTADFSTCVQDAIAAECKTYADAFSNATPCAVLNGDAAPATLDNCFPAGASYTNQEYINFTNFFCGQ